VPDIARIVGLSDGAQELNAESLPLASDQRSRLMDAAIRYTWSTGQRAIILQVEHWSRSRDLDLRRALRYTADLVLRHPDDVIVPVMVLCDHPAQPPVERLTVGLAEFQTIDFRVVVVEVQRDILPRWHRHPTRFLAVMVALVDDLPPVERGLRSVRCTMLFGDKFAATALPLTEDFATIAADEGERRRFHDRLRQDRTMASVIDIFRDEFKAEGKAEGKAEAALAMLRRRIARSTLTIDAARAEVDDLCREGDLTPDEAARIITRLG
jgi:hypothetical protein